MRHARSQRGADDGLPVGWGIAVLRLALVPVALLQTREVGVRLDPDLFPAVLIGFTAYAATMLAVSRARGTRAAPLPLGQALADLAFIAALVYTTGGARSPLRFAFYVMPVGAALRLSPRLTAAWSALALAAYLLVAIPHAALPGDVDLVLGEAFSLAWVSGAAVMLSVLVRRRERTLEALAAARRRLVHQSLDAEARERRRLAQALHDDAIQNVLLARQEVADLARGDQGAADRARRALDETDRQLREEVFAMHPVGLERAGLGGVLRSLASDAARRGRFEATVRVDPSADAVRDDLLVATARELLANAAQHAHASHVEVTVAVSDGLVRLSVADDGAGFEAERLERAPAAGHIGLAAARERLRAVGGKLHVDSVPSTGTTVTAVLPAPVPAVRRPTG